MEVNVITHKKPAKKKQKQCIVGDRVLTNADFEQFERDIEDTKRRKASGEDVSWNATREWFMSL